VRRRWERLRIVTKIWSSKNGFQEGNSFPPSRTWSMKSSFGKSSFLPPRGKLVEKTKKKNVDEGCCSFATICHLKKFRSFS